MDVITLVQSFQIVKTQQILLVSRGKENMKRFMRCHLVLIQQLGTAFEERGKREVVVVGGKRWLTPCRHDMHRLRYFETAMQSDCV